MDWYHICKADLTTSYRVFIDRVMKHKFTTIFFIFIAIAGTRLAVSFGVFLENLEQGDDPLYIERLVFSIIFFAFIFGKVGLYTYRKVLKEREMLTIFSQPINMYQITIGKYIANFVYISTLFITGFVLIYGWIIFELGFVGIPLDIVAEGVLLGILGLSLGFTLPIFLQLQPWYRKALYLSTNAIIIGLISIPIRFF